MPQTQSEQQALKTAKRIAEIFPVLQKVALGDFSHRITVPAEEDEFTELSVAINLMIDDLEQMFKDFENAKKASLNILEDLDLEKAKLAAEKAKDEAVLASIGDGVIATDENLRITIVNGATESILGYSAPELVGKIFAEVVVAQDEAGNPIPPEKRAISQAMATGKKVAKTLYYRHKDGSVFPAYLTVSPIIMGSKQVGVIEVFRDITHEAEVDRAKTEFVSLASHQLRTPLTSINWYAEMLLAGDAGKLAPDQENFVKEIYTGNQRMVELVNSLLNASRLELGTFAVEPVDTDLIKLAQNVVKEEEPNIFKRKIELNEDYSPNVPIVKVDPKLIRMVLQNLISNAVKYTPEQGQVDVSISLANSGAEPAKASAKIGESSDSVLITVKDTGYGIPESQKYKIFTKLFRADNIRQMDTEGTGLGLYIVKAIIEYSGGKIWFESKERPIAELQKAATGMTKAAASAKPDSSPHSEFGTTFFVQLPLTGMAVKAGTKQIS